MDEKLLAEIITETSFEIMKDVKSAGKPAEVAGMFVEGFSEYRKGNYNLLKNTFRCLVTALDISLGVSLYEQYM